MKLSFHAYVERQTRSPDAIWVMKLVQAALGFRDGLELDVGWASNLG